nr:ABC transporter permease [Brucella anthropi]
MMHVDLEQSASQYLSLLSPETGWWPFLWLLTLSLGYGAMHAAAQGHGKIVLAVYLAGSSHRLPIAWIVSTVLSFTHVLVAVIVVLLASSSASVTEFQAGSGVLTAVSGASLAFLGAVMLGETFLRRHPFPRRSEAILLGVAAGLVPCPFTLLVLPTALANGVMPAGLLLSLATAIGVAVIMGTAVSTAVMLRRHLMLALVARPRLAVAFSEALEIGAALTVLAFAAHLIMTF